MKQRLPLNRNRLKLAADAAGTTQRRLAQRLGFSIESLDARTRGRRQWRPEELESLEELLGVSVAWLMGDDKEGAP
jgi:transcriptional regulator with XRE-family HTH domain